MKKLNLFSILLFSVFFIFSCDDDGFDNDPTIGTTTGAYARKLDLTASLKLSDIPNSKIDISVEFVDGNDGNSVSSYDWAVAHRDVSSSGNVSNSVDLRSISASEFTTNTEGTKQADIEFKLQEIMDALGLTSQDLEAFDSFIFSAKLNLDSGVSFDSNNTSQSVITELNALFSFEEEVRP